MIEKGTTRNGEALLLEVPCLACGREPRSLMCELCETMEVAEMCPVTPKAEPVKA